MDGTEERRRDGMGHVCLRPRHAVILHFEELGDVRLKGLDVVSVLIGWESEADGARARSSVPGRQRGSRPA